jgi:hypothetical protein
MSDTFNINLKPWGYWVEVEHTKIAGVVKVGFEPDGVDFITPQNFGLQVGVMNRKQGYEIHSHYHLPVPRALIGTQEVLIVKRGTLRTDLYDENQKYLCSLQIGQGDIVILNSGGHGFVASEDCLFIEVKQGPYEEGNDKVIFPSAESTGHTLRIIQ